MTTKKDLVEAHAFSRRRLVTAFLSGAPGGREVEPTRPGRTILGGVSIAVLLLAGAAIASVLAPRAPQDWNSQGVVVTDQGARYIVTQDKGRLRPIINLASAQLILGLDVQTQVVSQKTVDAAKEPPGDPIGIQGAPESLPTTDRFIETGWTACTRDGAGVAVDISRSPRVSLASARQGFVVETPTGKWLIAQTVDEEGDLEAFRYQIPPSIEGQLMQHIFNPQPTTVPKVPESWVDLFPAGKPLDTSGFPKIGRRVPMQGANGADLVTGDIVKTEDGRYFLVRSDGWTPLSQFAAGVYLSTAEGSKPKALPSMPGDRSTQPLPQTNWPTNVLTPPIRPELCTELHTAHGATPAVRIGSASPGTAAWPDNPPPAGDTVQTVDPGMGAFVRSGSVGSAVGTLDYMVDSRGGAYLLQGGSTIASLGLTDYRDHTAPVVPDPWIKLLGQGTALSTEQALCPPATQASRKSGTCAPAPAGS